MFWLFQCNPEYFRLFDAIRDCADIAWPLRQHFNEISRGDGVVVWATEGGANSGGAYAFGRIKSLEPLSSFRQEDFRYWSSHGDLRRNTR
jgi:hypothetical protein